MHKLIKVNFWSGLLAMGLPGLYASSCVLPVCVAGQRRSSPGLMLGLLVLSSHDGTCGGRCSICMADGFWVDGFIMVIGTCGTIHG